MKNIAFIVACEKYIDPTLHELVGVNNDANLMKKAFIDNCGCSIDDTILCTLDNTEHRPENPSDIINMIFDVAEERKATRYERVFFYFSGHGFRHNNETYITVKNTFIKHKVELLDIHSVVSVLKEACIGKNIVCFFDMCLRDFGAKGSGSTSSGLVCEDGVIYFFSCLEGMNAYILPNGEGSRYTHFLSAALSKESNCSTVSEVDRFIRQKMSDLNDSTQKKQIPHTELTDATLNDLVITETPRFEGKYSEADLSMLELAKDLHNQLISSHDNGKPFFHEFYASLKAISRENGHITEVKKYLENVETTWGLNTKPTTFDVKTKKYSKLLSSKPDTAKRLLSAILKVAASSAASAFITEPMISVMLDTMLGIAGKDNYNFDTIDPINVLSTEEEYVQFAVIKVLDAQDETLIQLFSMYSTNPNATVDHMLSLCFDFDKFYSDSEKAKIKTALHHYLQYIREWLLRNPDVNTSILNEYLNEFIGK